MSDSELLEVHDGGFVCALEADCVLEITAATDHSGPSPRLCGAIAQEPPQASVEAARVCVLQTAAGRGAFAVEHVLGFVRVASDARLSLPPLLERHCPYIRGVVETGHGNALVVDHERLVAVWNARHGELT
ncbi:MAG: hypothetical protein OEZ06_28685 [Myxococcales bacterium]|nr:hypothetical protein [Myxococcales bacterium]